MKILMVNKFHYIKGGSETYYFALKRMLESCGHTVIDFSMEDKKNFESPYSKYFVSNVDYNSAGGIKNKIKIAKNIIYSKEAKEKFEELVQNEKPDIIHLHIFQHQISPSILDIIKKYNIPTIYTAHDLKMICLNYIMMHHGKMCEKCKNGHYIQCFFNKCVKDSYLKSSINVIEGYVHKWRKSYDVIDTIITPSLFYKKKFEEFGVISERVIHIPNFLDRKCPDVEELEDKEKYYLYFGRLSKEKGVLTLVKAAESSNINLKIVGTGPIQGEIKKYIEDNKINNVQMLGFKSGQELTNIVGNAKAVILPSEWYENGPYSAIESLQLGRPIIGADIGGIPELLKNNGMLFKSGDIRDLHNALVKFQNMNKQEYINMKKASIQLFNETYTKEVHYKMLRDVYKKLGLEL